MTIRVFYEGEIFVEYVGVESFEFHQKFLVFYKDDGSTVFINTDKIKSFATVVLDD